MDWCGGRIRMVSIQEKERVERDNVVLLSGFA